jgi:dipeptidyl aminopeptidase/acylaminoacyl peptidase
MNKANSTLRMIAELVIMGALIVGLGLGIQALLRQASPREAGEGQAAGQPYPPPAAAPTSTPEGYPPPPGPPPASTQFPPLQTGNRDPYPMGPALPTLTPYPSSTLDPGPTPTAVPLVMPAADAAGMIYYLASAGEGRVMRYGLAVDAKGAALNAADPLSEALDAAWEEAYPSPDGSRIIFLGEWCGSAIFYQHSRSVEPTFGNRIRPCEDFFDWHPDGSQVLLGLGPIARLWLVDTDTWEDIPLFVPVFGSVDGGAVSPDGRQVVFSYGGDLWMVNADGREARKVFALGSAAYHFAWSPDGATIAFTRNGLMLMDGNGENVRSLEKVTIPPWRVAPRWSPDSRYLLIMRTDPQAYRVPWEPEAFEGASLYLVDVQAGTERPLAADGKGGSLDPAWSPDGSQVVFASNRGGTPELWVVNLDGGNLRQLTNDGRMARFPVWVRP